MKERKRTMTKRLARHTLWPAMMLASFGAAATEGGIGRPITAQQVYSDAGIVPLIPWCFDGNLA